MAKLNKIKMQTPFEVSESKGEVSWYYVNSSSDVTALRNKIQNVVPKNLDKEITFPDWIIIEKYPDDTYRYVGLASSLKESFQHIFSRLETAQWKIEKEAIMQKTFTMHLLPEQYERIKNGTKTVEVRLWDAKRKNIRKDNIILFFTNDNKKEPIKTRVKDLVWFGSLEEAYEKYRASETGFDDTADIKDRVKYMHGFYSPEKERSNGVLAIVFTKI